MLRIICVESGKTVDAELYDVKPNYITVLLPSFQKLTLRKLPDKPTVYIAQQFGMEFYTNYP